MRSNVLQRITVFFLLAALCVSMAACGTEASPTVPTATEPTVPESTIPETTAPESIPYTPALYRITDNSGNQVYLFGSIHVGLPEMYPFPDYVLDAFNSSEALVLECVDATLEDRVAYDNAIRLEEGTTIRDYLPEDVYTTAVQILKDGHAYKPALEKVKPMMWVMALETLMRQQGDQSPAIGVDVTLQEMAKQAGKPIESAENLLVHNGALIDLSMEAQCALLTMGVRSYGSAQAGLSMVDTCRVWMGGDLEQMRQLWTDEAPADLTGQELQYYQEYEDAMIHRRDAQMTRYILEALTSGRTVFVCVGAAHVVLEGGILDRLTQAGCTVERVMPE